MDLLTFRHLWGVDQPLERCAPRFKEIGYEGIEGVFASTAERQNASSILREHDLNCIAIVFTNPNQVSWHSVEAHLESFKRGLGEALELEPRLVNVHAGYDAWNDSDTTRFFEAALDEISRLKAAVGFETHRGRCLNTPWRTAALLESFPDLRLVLDVSHWVVVCERLPDDQAAALKRAAQACVHLHARVGSEQSPQVNDPRAPEHAERLAWFERQWSAIWAAQAARGDAFSSLTPEFGPPDYQPVLPFTRMPTGDLEAICDWMATRQLERFKR